MRIKIRPVRWWRDDATRYAPRGASERDMFGPSPVEFIRKIAADDMDEMLAWFEGPTALTPATPNAWGVLGAADPLDDIHDWQDLELNRVRFSPPRSPFLVPMEFETMAPMAPMPPMPSALTPFVIPDRDPGDEDRGPLAMRFVMGRYGGAVCRYPGHPLYAPPQPDHDPGDEQPVVVGIGLSPLAYVDGI